MKKGALFLDRDGVINKDKSYVYKYSDVEWMPGIFDLIKFANNNLLYVIVLTNQSGIERNYYTEDDVNTLHRQMDDVLKKEGAHVDAWYFCPSLNSEDRKPNPGMMNKATADFDIDLEKSFMLGDKVSDVITKIGPKFCLLKGNYDLTGVSNHVKIVDDIYRAMSWIKTNLGQS